MSMPTVIRGQREFTQHIRVRGKGAILVAERDVDERKLLEL
jgi:hypothetical protein